MNISKFIKLYEHINRYGVSFTIKKLYYKYRFQRKKMGSKVGINVRYPKREHKSHPIVSIIVPVYKPENIYLRQMFESVLCQSYPDWQLCICNGDKDESSDIHKMCMKYAKKDKRISYKRVVNKGISGNTAEALRMASGQYITFLDHDDILHPQALEELVWYAKRSEADMLYTDEALFQSDIQNIIRINFKPGFMPDYLRSGNYICHMLMISADLCKKTGVPDSKYDGSQDFDYVLRLSENAKSIIHIPKVLYYWRCHKNSVASGLEAKPYVVEAGKRALEAHLRRQHINGMVVPDRYRKIVYNIKYPLQKSGLNELIICREGMDIKKCFDGKKKYILLLQRNVKCPEKKQLSEILSYAGDGKGILSGVLSGEKKIFRSMCYYDRDGKVFDAYAGMPVNACGYLNRLLCAYNTVLPGEGGILMNIDDFNKYIFSECEKTGSSPFDTKLWQKAAIDIYKDGKNNIFLPWIRFETKRYNGYRGYDNVSEFIMDKNGNMIMDKSYNPWYKDFKKYIFYESV